MIALAVMRYRYRHSAVQHSANRERLRCSQKLLKLLHLKRKILEKHPSCPPLSALCPWPEQRQCARGRTPRCAARTKRCDGRGIKRAVVNLRRLQAAQCVPKERDPLSRGARRGPCARRRQPPSSPEAPTAGHVTRCSVVHGTAPVTCLPGTSRAGHGRFPHGGGYKAQR